MRAMNTLFKTPELSKLDKADPMMLLRAIAIVQARYEGHEHQRRPGAECWIADTRRYRPAMIQDVFLEWATMAGTDVIFPWHDDYVAEVWVTFRKQRLHAKREWWDYFSVTIPDRILAKLESEDGKLLVVD